MRRLALACLLLLAIAIPAHAEDAPATDEAVVDFATLAKRWPAPSAASAFAHDLVVIIGENPMGTWEVSAAPREVDGKVAGWRVHESLQLDFGGKQASGTGTMEFTTDLRPVAGTARDGFADAPVDQTFTTKDGTITVVHKPAEGEAKTWTLASQPWMLPGKPGLLMLARFVPLRPMTVRGTNFSVTDDEGPTSAFTVAVDPGARYEGRKALVLRGQRRNDRIELIVDPETRDILRVRMTKTDSALQVTMVPKADAPAKDDIFAREPRTVAEASAHVLYAITMKEAALIEKSFHWELMFEHAKKQLEASQQPIPTFEAWRTSTAAQLGAGAPPAGVTAEQVKAGLQAVIGQVQVRDAADGAKAVIWPKSFAHILVVLAEKDGVWKAIGLRKLS